MNKIFMICAWGLGLQFSAWSAPLYPSVLAEMRERGDTCGLGCPSGVGDVWSRVSSRGGQAGGFLAPNQTATPSGTVKIAGLLVQFQDIKFSGDTTKVGDSIEILLNRADTYYRAVSYNRMKLSYTVFDTAMVTASQNQAAYTSTVSPAASNTNHKNLVTEVLGRVDTFVNFGAYDVVAIFHAGVAKQISGAAGDLNTQFFGFDNTISAFRDTQTNDTVTMAVLAAGFGKVLSNGETVTMFGTFCHEFGHALGLPDLYNVDIGGGGISSWGLMGTGNYLGKPQGDSPSWMDAWCREYLGWADTKLIDTAQSLTITKVEADSKIYKIKANASVDTEYFLLEVREPTNSGLDTSAGSGLLIWHIDNSMGKISDNNVNKTSNTDGLGKVVAHRRVDLEEADGSDCSSSNSGTAAQPWPGSGNSTGFGDNSSPSSRGYYDTIARFALKSIAMGSSVSLTADFSDVTVTTTPTVKYPSTCVIGRALAFSPRAAAFARSVRDKFLETRLGRCLVKRLFKD